MRTKAIDKYQNKYRIKSARLSSWDYSWNGMYFITICTHNRGCIFGEIAQRKMGLSSIGGIVIEEWYKSFQIRKELFCDAFVLMPNHLHAIVRIDHGVETHGRASLHREKNNYGVAYRPPKSISSFVAGFKSASTKRINGFRNTPKMKVWQPRFHDHIIRSEEEYNRIFEYIENNLKKWNDDKYHL